MAENEMLVLRDLRKTFNPGTVMRKMALAGVDLVLNKGDFITVIGGNGAGKSTMLNAIAGTFPIDNGTILLGGRDVTHLPEHRRAAFLGRVFQDPMTGTAASMNIEENLALASRRGQPRGLRWGITAKERALYREKLASLDLGLESRMGSKVGLLSGGQRQALTLLMATEKVLRLTRHLIQENGLTALMVTHNMKDALALGNRTIMMHEGKVILDLDEEQKRHMTVEDLLAQFEKASGRELSNDRMLLT